MSAIITRMQGNEEMESECDVSLDTCKVLKHVIFLLPGLTP